MAQNNTAYLWLFDGVKQRDEINSPRGAERLGNFWRITSAVVLFNRLELSSESDVATSRRNFARCISRAKFSAAGIGKRKGMITRGCAHLCCSSPLRFIPLCTPRIFSVIFGVSSCSFRIIIQMRLSTFQLSSFVFCYYLCAASPSGVLS